MRGKIPLRFRAAKREPAGPRIASLACAKLPSDLPERPPCARSRTVQKHRASKRPVGELAVIIDNSGASWRNLASRDACSSLYQSACYEPLRQSRINARGQLSGASSGDRLGGPSLGQLKGI